MDAGLRCWHTIISYVWEFPLCWRANVIHATNVYYMPKDRRRIGYQHIFGEVPSPSKVIGSHFNMLVTVVAHLAGLTNPHSVLSNNKVAWTAQCLAHKNTCWFSWSEFLRPEGQDSDSPKGNWLGRFECFLLLLRIWKVSKIEANQRRVSKINAFFNMENRTAGFYLCNGEGWLWEMGQNGGHIKMWRSVTCSSLLCFSAFKVFKLPLYYPIFFWIWTLYFFLIYCI